MTFVAYTEDGETASLLTLIDNDQAMHIAISEGLRPFWSIRCDTFDEAVEFLHQSNGWGSYQPI